MLIRDLIRGRFPGGVGRAAFGCILAGAAYFVIAAPAFADYAAGLDAFNRREFPRAFSEWIESAKAGDPHAQHGIGMLYELGQGVPYADAKTAASWYEKGAAQNYAPAINNLARLHADGRGVDQDVAKAIALWGRAAEAGNATARFNLGLQYANGNGVTKDAKKAAAYMLQAAEGGLAEAQYTMAGFYRDGVGVAKDVAAARQWFDRAATAGYEQARTALSNLEKSEAEAVSTAPAVEATPAEPAETQATSEQKSEEAKPAEQAPASITDAEAKPEEAASPATGENKPDENATQETPATQEQAAHETPPEQTPATEPAAQATSEQGAGTPPEEAPPAEQGEATSAEPEAEGAAHEGEQVADAKSNLPLAESLTGDEQIFRIWLYESGQRADAQTYWDKLQAQYPALLKPLELDLRQYVRGDQLGSVYRVFAGPFEDLGAAQKACVEIKERFGDQLCRTVIN